MNPKGEKWAIEKKEHWDALANEKINLLENAFQEHINWICQYSMPKKTTESAKRRLSQDSSILETHFPSNTSDTSAHQKLSSTSPTLPLAKRQCIDLCEPDQPSEYKENPDIIKNNNETTVVNDSRDSSKILVENGSKDQNMPPKPDTKQAPDPAVLLSQKSKISTGSTRSRKTDLLDENDTVRLLVPSKSKSTPTALEKNQYDSISMRSLSFGRGFNHTRPSFTENSVSYQNRVSQLTTKTAIVDSKESTSFQLNSKQNDHLEPNTSAELMPPPTITVPLKDQFMDIPSEKQITGVESIEKTETRNPRATNESFGTTASQDYDDEFLDILDVIPDWVKSPLFEHLLEKQTHMDPDKIFGRIPPINWKNIFTKPRHAKH
ncbi:hypothetical protein CLU79DRAFT_743866 [Phycomyces nitens]|nr:hypothetical protein CLU79DRAFT_743866 [Phycomyces nitens]